MTDSDRETTIYWLANDTFYVYTDEGLQAMISDSDRESLIDAAYEQMVAAADEATQRKHWADMIYHVRLRSAEQVFKMEAERRISSQYAPLVTYQMGDVA